jgi:hypothetical protein
MGFPVEVICDHGGELSGSLHGRKFDCLVISSFPKEILHYVVRLCIMGKEVINILGLVSAALVL